jgi:PKD repeat protein
MNKHVESYHYLCRTILFAFLVAAECLIQAECSAQRDTALIAAFTYSPSSPTQGQSVQFTDTSTGSPTSWQWHFGDGTTSGAQNPRHIFAAVASYTTSLTASSNSGSNTASKTINVMPASTLTASFAYSPGSPNPGQAVQFTDTSTGSPTSWLWDFGDETTNMAQNPSHTFAAVASYTVSLTVSNNSGSNSTSQAITVVAASTIVPSERRIDWSRAGVWVDGVKGIPNYAVGVTCVPPTYAVDPTGVTDSTAGINAAIRACASGRAVYLPAGTYKVSGTIDLRSRVALRGAGPGVTTIFATANNVYFEAAALGDVNAIIDDPGPGPDASNISGPIASGYTKGSYTVVVSSALATNLSAGNIVLINQTNDPSFVTYHGSEDDCTWAGGTGTRALGETKIIASKSGTSITFTRPLCHEYKNTLNPKLIRMSTSPILNAGIENLTFDGGGYTMDRCVYFYGAAHCWVKTVEIKNQTGFGVQIYWGSIGCEVTKCYFHDPTDFGSSSGYGVVIHGCATDNYIYDNISKWAKLVVAIGSSGGTANVAAYNYCYSTNHSSPWWAMPAVATHGAHTLMNLFEGNIGPMAESDATHGSGSHNIFFRNWLNGLWHNPAVTSAMYCALVEDLNYYITYIGNVLGYSGMTGAYETDPYVERNIINIWRQGTDSLTRSSLIRHGNYDYITNSTVWEGSIAERDIPPSLYLNSKPSWFGALDWPAIGPDIVGYTKNTPSKLRWDTYVSSGILSDLFSK